MIRGDGREDYRLGRIGGDQRKGSPPQNVFKILRTLSG